MKRAIVLVVGLVLVGSGGAEAAARLTTKTCYRPSGAKVRVTSKKRCSAYGMSAVAPPTVAPTPSPSPVTVAATIPPPAQSAIAPTVPLPTELETFLPVVFVDGKGNGISKTFNLPAGLAIVSSTYDGPSNFIAYALDSNGAELELVANRIGSSKGSSIWIVPKAGTYSFQVSSSGGWVIDVATPRPKVGVAPPVGFEGSGPAVVGPIAARTNYRVAAQGSGRSNFIVYGFDGSGSSELLVNVIAPASSETVMRGRGLIYLEVAAQGAWAIQISPF